MRKTLSRLHALALVAYPRQFRQDFAAELQQAFELRVEGAASRRGRAPALALALWLLADALASGLAERAHVARRQGSIDRPPIRFLSQTPGVPP